MKYLVTIALTALLFLGTAQAADTGLWYNPERDGEGINLITQDKTVVLFFYTYRDVVTEVPPSVSPAPPAVEAIAPNSAIWYYGQAGNFDGEVATGVLHTGEAFNYPNAVELDAGAVEEVGRFTLLRDGEGWLLEIEYSWNYLVPWHVSLYGIHSFPTPLITK